MTNTTMPKELLPGPLEQPQPDSETIEVDAGTSSAIHELELEGEADQVPVPDVAPENQPLEERDA